MIRKIPQWLSIISITLNILFFGYIVKKVLPHQKLPYTPAEYKAYSKSKIINTDIVFIGDSQTDRFPVAEMFNNINYKNRGISGDKSAGVLKRIDTVANAMPKKIFLCVGINDLLASIPVDTVISNISKAIILVKTKSPKTVMYVQSLFPSSWKKFDGSEFVIADEIATNAKLEKVCKDNNIRFLNLFTAFKENAGLNSKYDCGDHVHLSSQGYEKWKELLTPYL